MKAKRYIVLVGDIYYPAAWDDFVGTYPFIEEAMTKAKNCLDSDRKEYTWAEIVDLETCEVVANSWNEDHELRRLE